MARTPTQNNRAERARSITTQKAARELEQRAEAIINDVMRYDIDTRQAVLLALKNLTFYRPGGGDYYRAEELPARLAEYERELREKVMRAEAGERATESGVGEEYDAAARTVIDLLDNAAVPDFFRDGLVTLINLFGADTGARLWQETTEGDGATGGYSIDTLAYLFATRSTHSLEIERKKDLADLISAVLKHPDTPVNVYNAITDGINSLNHDYNAPEFIRHVLGDESKEVEG